MSREISYFLEKQTKEELRYITVCINFANAADFCLRMMKRVKARLKKSRSEKFK